MTCATVSPTHLYMLSLSLSHTQTHTCTCSVTPHSGSCTLTLDISVIMEFVMLWRLLYMKMNPDTDLLTQQTFCCSSDNQARANKMPVITVSVSFDHGCMTVVCFAACGLTTRSMWALKHGIFPRNDIPPTHPPPKKYEKSPKISEQRPSKDMYPSWIFIKRFSQYADKHQIPLVQLHATGSKHISMHSVSWGCPKIVQDHFVISSKKLHIWHYLNRHHNNITIT